MRRRDYLVILAPMLMALLIACGNSGGEKVAVSAGQMAGDASRGETLYKQTSIGPASAPGCITCHSLEPDFLLVGPSHAGIGTRAETAVPGQAAEAYLWESITEPDAHVTEGFAAGAMYQYYGKDLSDQEIADLVAFLVTLR